jgi:hypothetical protein
MASKGNVSRNDLERHRQDNPEAVQLRSRTARAKDEHCLAGSMITMSTTQAMVARTEEDQPFLASSVTSCLTRKREGGLV